MKERLEGMIAAAIRDLFNIDIKIDVSRPEKEFGDYATNAALQLAPKLKRQPHEIAEQLQPRLSEALSDYSESVTIADPGFINIRLKEAALWYQAQIAFSKPTNGQTVVIEYSDPNPFKMLHAGHLYTSIVGDAIANLLSSTGASVHRVNFGGDVGLHVAKTLWAIIFYEGQGNLDNDVVWHKVQALTSKTIEERTAWLADYYTKGNNAYKLDLVGAKAAIDELNKQIYKFHEDNDHASAIAQIYWTCRDWSYSYFDKFYDLVGIHFEKFYPESETVDIGIQKVREHIGDVFTESDGAVVFTGEDHGLHTRVFITSQGLPTYEAKDVGLLFKKWDDYHFTRSIVITSYEQTQYMAVVLKAIEQFAPDLAHASQHITHGEVKLTGAKKMSSRLGNIVKAIEVLNTTADTYFALTGKRDDRVILGAVKYAFLKQRLGSDIIYNPIDSVSLEGNSGPYLQYAYVRASSILSKTEPDDSPVENLQPDERKLLLKISEYQEVIDKAIAERLPHYICTYLYELAQIFNQFYEHNRVIGNDREAVRIKLVRCYTCTLRAGLELLGVPVLDTM